ncbi:MAG TPA: hypothetical protein PKD16_17995 [Saprospiraceae bacterium]|jgi:hypothetical protein|nr:hypothetical protein [Saprospiraceae bacterium]HMT72066.1 hypothetical protein [Saprospiraceae bacterium]
MNIEEFLTRWKSESYFGERQYEKQSISLVQGQVLYLITFKACILEENVNRIIEKSKFFQTRVQGLKEKDGINLNEDNYVCEQILNQLETDFFKDYNDIIDVVVRKKICL